MPPDSLPLAGSEAESDELRCLEAAIAQARVGGPGIPHEQVRERMLEMMAEARVRIAAPLAEGSDQRS